MLGLSSLAIIFISSALSQNFTEIKIVKGPKFTVKQRVILNQVIAFYALEVEESLCKNHTKDFKNGLRKFEPWTLKMVDSSSKLQPGILSGNTGEFGSYDECINIKTSTENGQIFGKMCTVDIILGPTLSRHILKLRNISEDKYDRILSSLKFDTIWTVCIPHSCTYSQVQNHFNKTIQGLVEGLDLKISVAKDNCMSKMDETPLNTTQWILIIFLSSLLVFVLLSTFYDVCTQQCNVKQNEVVLIFSAYSNGKYLLSSKNNEFDCLHGIRSLSIIWVILGHRYFLTLYIPVINGLDILDWSQTALSSIVLGGTFSVDTFFTMSGLLLTYYYFVAMEKGIKFNIFLFYLKRLIRVNTSLTIVVLFYIFLLERLSSGPIWNKAVHGLKDNCVDFWWSTLLHVQNIFNPANVCIIQTWYLSCDMQYYYLSPLILIPVYKWRRFGMFLFFIWLILSIIYSFNVAWVNKYNGGMPVATNLLTTEYFVHHYIMSSTRGTPYLIGMAFGYILFHTKDKKIKFNPAFKTLGWILSLICLSSAVFGSMPFENLNHKYNRFESSIYLALSRPFWSLALIWIIFNCIHGMAGPVNTFLSQRIFKVIAKLSYCMYLTHIGIQYSRNGAEKVAYQFTDFNLVYLFFGDLACTILVAVLLAFCVEFPIMKIESLFKKKGSKKVIFKKVKPMQVIFQ